MSHDRDGSVVAVHGRRELAHAPDGQAGGRGRAHAELDQRERARAAADALGDSERRSRARVGAAEP
ncbi:MAG TPA: hypothetical protein VHX88_00645 [Solirubrobacteraceae bacterium]|nr:hypothetical protein [Solirubrobacteraceae bacterium]